MRTWFFVARCLAFLVPCLILWGCSTSQPVDTPYQPGFFYLNLQPEPVLVVMDSPEAVVRKKISLIPPTDCSLYSLHPAPVGRWIAVEWECSFGPAVEIFNSSSGESHFVLSDPTIDSRLLAWLPDGRSLFVKIGTLSVPQVLRVDAATSRAVELPLSPFTYDLAGSPGGRSILFSLSKGVGFGSETWLAGPDGQNPSQFLVDPQNIISLAQFSPDGTRIAFFRLRDTQSNSALGDLWVMDAAGSNERKLAQVDVRLGISPSWSPDGTRIAFASGASDRSSTTLSIYDLQQGKLASYPLEPVTTPAWSPDGSLVSFSTRSDGALPFDAWFYEIKSGQVRKIAAGACCAGWIR